MSTPRSPADAMLAHGHFVRDIVRSLLAGADGEDDVVQQAMLRAVERGPDRPERLRAWLARVARNLAIDHLRAGRRRRSAHAEQAADPGRGPVPSSADVLQQEEERRRVVTAVLALPQPYRGVLLLRYWEDLEPSAIAARLGLPAGTVRSQLKRGLELLRAQLDATYGRRSAWLAALTPFAAVAAPAPVAATGATLLSLAPLLMTHTKLAALGAALAGAGILTWLLATSDPRPEPTPVASAPSDAVPASTTPAATDSGAPAVAATPPATVPQRSDAALPDESALVVSGRVTHEGVPVGDLPVQLAWFDGFGTDGTATAEHELRADADGRFVWRGERRAAAATVRAMITAPGIVAWAATELVEPGQAAVELELAVLPLTRTLRGRVHDTDGRPIADAELSINRFPATVTRSGDDGHYELRVPPAGYPLIVAAKGYCSRIEPSYMPDDATTHTFDVELRPGVTVAGRVVDEQAMPVAGAVIRTSGAFASAVTGADGTFELDAGVPGTGHEVTARKPGFQPARVIAEAGDRAVELVLRPGLRLVVRAVDSAGEGIAGARVSIVPDRMAAWQRMGTTQTDGRFRLEDLAAKEFELVLEKKGYIRVKVAVDPGAAVDELALEMRPGHTTRGRVVDPDGHPLAGASIYCQRPTGSVLDRSVGGRDTTGVDGRFEIDGLPPEPFVLYAHHPDYTRAEVEFAAGDHDGVEVRMQPAVAVRGRVLDGTTGKPVAQFTIAIAPVPEIGMFPDPEVFDSSDGRFRISDWRMKAGMELFLEVRADGYARQRLRGNPALDPAPDQLLIRLFPGVEVTGVLRDAATREPIAGAHVDIRYGTPDAPENKAFETMLVIRRERRGERTDAEGRFAFADVPAGPARLTFAGGGYASAVFGPFEVGAGPGRLELEPTLSAGVALRGRVTGVAEPGKLRVQAERGPGDYVKVRVAADGTFEFTGIGTGTTRLWLGVADRTYTTQVTVGDTDVEGVEFAVRPGSGAVRVAVRGLAAGEVWLRAIGDSEAARRGTRIGTEFAAGEVVVDGLAPSRYTVEVLGEGGRNRSAEVEVGSAEVTVTVDIDSR
ncbi:MAG: sigma-70 family RNA polymerase sigma factor [Planctomycetes bacterium]|nr:sigma-70 family RNA polymerase sigma factor [Planctomycetota bacterium]